MRLHGQAVKTSPFHGGNPGSIPGGVTKKQTPFFRVSVFCYSAKESERVATSNPLFAKNSQASVRARRALRHYADIFAICNEFCRNPPVEPPV